MELKRSLCAKGIEMLAQPVMPLVSMVQFFYITGQFETVEEVVAELPAPIETNHAVYPDPGTLLTPYMDLLHGLHGIKAGLSPEEVIDAEGLVLDSMTATSLLVGQQVLTREMEAINSALCEPCHCTLCCVGPEEEMVQAFFEIPLEEREVEQFPVERVDTVVTRSSSAMTEPPVEVDGTPFYEKSTPLCLRFATGWSLILPRSTRCPSLEMKGRCSTYRDRPQVCRRPQIFVYLLEPYLDGNSRRKWRQRNSLLAITDCPYVRLLREEIAAYGAACELETVFTCNKG
ncbi:MAG: hypothetical protein CSA34_06040 [Desulfobulbus propionicus]|nr:MAG: hypothetical protein CSA34_06040 [Desulfobulbus propionicus]